MINVIIYEDNQEMQRLYQEEIKNFFEKRNHTVNFYLFSHYSKDLEKIMQKISRKKLFILDIEVPGKSGLDLAREIRGNGDWISPFIIITNHDSFKNTGFTSKTLLLDFISKKENRKERLQEALETAYEILNRKETYTFQYNGEIHHISYQDILYFEKDLNDNYTFLYTEDYSYKVKDSISNIQKELENHPNFFKTHRSCIINVKQVDYLDLENNQLSIRNHVIRLLTKEKKEKLKKLLQKEKSKITENPQNKTI